MARTMIYSIDELVEALGGPTEVGEWLGIGKNAVSNWSMRGYIPPAWHLRLLLEIMRRGLTVHPVVFGLKDEDFFVFFKPSASAAGSPAIAVS